MRCKSILFVALMSAIALLSTANTAKAQRGRTARPAPARATTYRYQAGYYPYYRYGYPRYYNYSPFWYGSPYLPYYSYYYVPPTTYYVPTPSYDVVPPTSYYPAPIYGVQPTAPVTASAEIRVILPDAQAMVWFDGQPTTSTGSERFYHTPPLALGGSHQYRIGASWRQGGHNITQERVVSVMPGQTTTVDFRQGVSEEVSPPVLGK